MTTTTHAGGTVTLHHGDCLNVLRQLPDNSVHAIVTDPPYGLTELPLAVVVKALAAWLDGDREHVPDGKGFMGRSWDAFVPPPAVWDEAFRVLKPGGHVLAFAGSRTHDLMATSIRLAGFEKRDSIAWLYGSGFPKSLDVGKAIDKAGGNPLAFRAFARAYAAAVEASPLTHTDIDRHLGIKSSSCYWVREDHRGGMPPRHHWDAVRALLSLPDRYTQLYDAAEREVTQAGVGRHRPGDVIGFDQRSSTDRERRDIPATDAAREWAGWGTALKPAFEPIVVARKPLAGTVAANVLAHGTGALNLDACRVAGHDAPEGRTRHGGGIPGNGSSYELADVRPASPAGRWPANVVLSGDQADALDAQTGTLTSGKMMPTHTEAQRNTYGQNAAGGYTTMETYGDSGGASRFFPTFRYQAKAPTRERPSYVKADGTKVAHPTVKPVELMRWLVRLVTPPGGTVLELFAGSGPTVEACILEGFPCIAIEREADYLPLIVQRIDRAVVATTPAAQSAPEPVHEPNPRPVAQPPGDVIVLPGQLDIFGEEVA